MQNLKNKTSKFRDEIPENFESYEAAAEFWDSHDVSDYLDLTEEVPNVQIKLRRKHFKIEPDITAKLSQKAREKGISTETLINLWLQEKLFESEKLDQ
jgi:hypothetical protein